MGTERRDYSPLRGRTVCTTSSNWSHAHERRATSCSGHVCGCGRNAHCCRCFYHTPCVLRRRTFCYWRYPGDHLPYVDADGLWLGSAMDCDSDCYKHVFHHDHGTASGYHHSGSRIYGGRYGPEVTLMPRGNDYSHSWSILATTPGALYLWVGLQLHAPQGSLFQ